MNQVPYTQNILDEVMHFLQYDGYETTLRPGDTFPSVKEKWIAEFFSESWDQSDSRPMKGFVLYCGPGSVKMTIAVYSWNFEAAISAYEDWVTREGRDEDIYGDDYEYYYCELPIPIVSMPEAK